MRSCVLLFICCFGKSLLRWAELISMAGSLELTDSVVVYQQRFMLPGTNSSVACRIGSIVSILRCSLYHRTGISAIDC